MTSSPLPELTGYPRVQRLYSDDFRRIYAQNLQHAPDFMYAILVEAGEECDGYRRELEDLLEVGERLGMLDAQMAGRLVSRDISSFLAAFSELETAKFLDDRRFKVTAAPTGSPGRVGDMQVETEHPVFVEVKAVLDRSEEAIEQRVISGLIRYAEDVFDEFSDSVVATFSVLQGGSFGHRHLEGWLRRVFR